MNFEEIKEQLFVVFGINPEKITEENMLYQEENYVSFWFKNDVEVFFRDESEKKYHDVFHAIHQGDYGWRREGMRLEVAYHSADSPSETFSLCFYVSQNTSTIKIVAILNQIKSLLNNIIE